MVPAFVVEEEEGERETVEKVQLVPTKPPAKVRRMEEGMMGWENLRVRD